MHAFIEEGLDVSAKVKKELLCDNTTELYRCQSCLLRSEKGPLRILHATRIIFL